jgi:uncharacterized integral membrane protein
MGQRRAERTVDLYSRISHVYTVLIIDFFLQILCVILAQNNIAHDLAQL